MVERSKITLATRRSSEDLALFHKAIEKTGSLSLPMPVMRPRGFMAARAGFQPALRAVAADPDPTVMIGNWFWNIN